MNKSVLPSAICGLLLVLGCSKSTTDSDAGKHAHAPQDAKPSKQQESPAPAFPVAPVEKAGEKKEPEKKKPDEPPKQEIPKVVDNSTAKLQANSKVTRLTFSHDGKRLAVGQENGTIDIWDVKTRKRTHSLKSSGKEVSTIAFSDDGRLLAAVSAFTSVFGDLELWNLESKKVVGSVEAYPSAAPLLFSKDSTKLISRSISSRTWQISKKPQPSEEYELKEISVSHIKGLQGRRISSSAYSSDGNYCLVGESCQTRIADPGSPPPYSTVIPQPRFDGVEPACDISVWNVADGKLMGEFGKGENKGWTEAIVVVPSKNHVLSAHSPSGDIKFWERMLPAFGTHSATAQYDHRRGMWRFLGFSPDATKYAMTDGKDIEIYGIGISFSDGRYSLQTTKEADLKGNNGLKSYAFSPQSSVFVAASTDRSIRLWELTKKE